MPQIRTTLDSNSEGFKANEAHNQALAGELREKVAIAALGGSESHRERHVARGKLLPRDRVQRLLDPGSPLLEIGQPEAGAGGGIAIGWQHMVSAGGVIACGFR